VSYIKRFVNSYFRQSNNELLEKAERGKKTTLRKELDKDLYEIKQDLLNNTSNSNPIYHAWINTHRPLMFPAEFKDSYEFDIKNHPQKYLKHMIYMCLELEKLKAKTFQFFPIRTNIVPKYIPIDTASLVDLFINENKQNYINNIEEYKKQLWSGLFKTSDPAFRQKQYEFDYRILTDGFAVSIQLINKGFIEKEKEKKKARKEANQNARQLYKDLTAEEIDEIKFKKEQDKIKKCENVRLEKKKKRDVEKEEFKNLSKEEQQKQKELIKQEKEKQKKEQYIEYPYLEELNETEYQKLKKDDNWAVTDPGKNTIIYMKDNKGNFFRYSNKRHLNKTKQKD